MRGEVDTGFIGRRKPLGAIRRSRDDDWMPLVSDRPIHIRIQRHPVAHRDRHPVVERDVVAFRHVGRWEPHGCCGLDSRRGSLRDGDEDQEWKQEQDGASTPCHEDSSVPDTSGSDGRSRWQDHDSCLIRTFRNFTVPAPY